MPRTPDREAAMVAAGATVKTVNAAALTGEAPVGMPQARGVVVRPTRMNKTESAYAVHLDARRQAREVAAYWFGSVKLRLADKTWYHPDFLVLLADGRLEMHETKGFMRDDAAVKVKTAAEVYPLFHFYLVRRVRGGWDVRLVAPGEGRGCN